jgi:propionate catabolism operon transcriptional regulator
MTDRDIKIGIICSTPHFLEVARPLVEKGGFQAQLVKRGLEESVPAGLEMERRGVEVVVSRRGTAQLLRKSLNVPVLSVPTTSFDVFLNTRQAANLGKRILMPSFHTQLNGLQELEQTLGVEIKSVRISGAADLEEQIRRAKQEGFEVVIGGGVSMALAAKHGLYGVEIQTSPEAIASTLEDARAVVLSRREEQAVTQRYRTIIDASGEGIIAVDAKGKVTTINRLAQTILGITGGQGRGRDIQELLPQSTILEAMASGSPRLHQVEKIKADHYIMDHVPVKINEEVVGASPLSGISPS